MALKDLEIKRLSARSKPYKVADEAGAKFEREIGFVEAC
jgi:hypothetical protein